MYKYFIILFVCLFLRKGSADKPCAARAVDGQSVLCVCNSTYCDDITREAPASGKFVAYTSSEGGLRFNKINDELEEAASSGCCTTTLTINPAKTFQTIEGFGGAVTDSAGLNWRNLSETLQDELINAYYGDNGLQYNMVRVPIGGADFSTRLYTYNDLPENDATLSNFSLAYEDYHYKLPMIKKIMSTSSTPVEIVASTWSPPLWMKSSNKSSGFSHLKEEYYQTYADYHKLFLEHYAKEGVNVWAITTTNEPVNGVVPFIKINSLGWTPDHMGKWIVNNLGPTIRNSTFKDIKILALDDQRYTIPVWFELMVKKHPKALDYIDGVAVHYYGDMFTPASLLSSVSKNYPGKFVIATEACEGSFPWQRNKVELGSWSRAKHYIEDILEDLNHNVVGWIDWNLCLDAKGGPNWVNNNVDSPIIVYPEAGEFVKQPMFYAMGHFAKFVPRGSQRIEVKEKKPLLKKSIDNAAFLTPRGTIVAVLYNGGGERNVAVKLGEQLARLLLDSNSVTTVEFPYQSSGSE